MTPFSVEGFRAEKVRFRTPGAANAKAAWAEREGLILHAQAGPHVGRGEASPLPGYSPDTLTEVAAVFSQLSSSRPQIDEGAPWPSIAAWVRDAVPAHLPSLRFAFEGALLDLASQRLERPVLELLGVAGARECPVAEVLTQLETAEVRAEVAVGQGIRTLKLKIGRAGQWNHELQLVGRLRSTYPQLRLRLDANQGFEPAHLHRLEQLRPFDIEFIEEPVSLEHWHSVPAGLPLALDESLRRPDAERVLEQTWPRLGAIVVKPAVLGGLAECLGWARRAQALGVPAVTSHLFDGPVAAGALRALALALPGSGVAQGLGQGRAHGARVRPSPGLGLFAEIGVGDG